MRFSTILIVSGLLFSCDTSNTGSINADPKESEPVEGAAEDVDAFYRLCGYAAGNFVPETASSIRENADLIVIGMPVAVHQGMVVRDKDAKAAPDIETVVVEVSVSKTVKGPEQDTVYFELIQGSGIPLSEWNERLPKERWLLFLAPTTWADHPSIEYLHSDRGYPEGEPHRHLVTPQGLVVSRGRQAFQPLAHSAELQLFEQGVDGDALLAGELPPPKAAGGGGSGGSF